MRKGWWTIQFSCLVKSSIFKWKYLLVYTWISVRYKLLYRSEWFLNVLRTSIQKTCSWYPGLIRTSQHSMFHTLEFIICDNLRNSMKLVQFYRIFGSVSNVEVILPNKSCDAKLPAWDLQCGLWELQELGPHQPSDSGEEIGGHQCCLEVLEWGRLGLNDVECLK